MSCMVLFGKKKEPFSTEGLEKLSREEQEAVLSRVAVREAELLEKKKKKPTSKKELDIEVEKRVKVIEKQKGFSRLRESLAKAEEKRRLQKELQSKQPIKKRVQQFIPTTRRGISPMQRRILNRERVLKLLRETKPMDRARVLNHSSEFIKARDAIRGVNSLEKAKNQSGLVSFQNSQVQQAQERFKDKINAAKLKTQTGEKIQSTFGGIGIIASKLKAPPSLL